MAPPPFLDAAAVASWKKPLYLGLCTHVRDRIASGELRPGDSLPSERDMAAMTGLSRVTVRKAMQTLVGSGHLEQRHGSGTFVAGSGARLEQSLSQLTSFSEDMARRGLSSQSRWIARGVHWPTSEETMVLGLGAQDQVARLARVRMADGRPLAIERATLSTAILPDPMAVTGSLYAVLDRAGFRPVRAVQRISALSVGPDDAALLDVAPAAAVLRIERISYLASGRVVEMTRSLYRGDAYDFTAELKIGPVAG